MAEAGTQEAYAKLEPSYLQRFFPTAYTAAVTVFLINFALGVPTSALADVLKYRVAAPTLLLFWAQLAVLGMGKAIADLVGGYFVDRWRNGRRNVMITGTVLVVIGSALIWLSFPDLTQAAVDTIRKTHTGKKALPLPAFDTLPFLLIMGGQFLNGFGIGMQNGAAMILLQDLGGATKRGLGASLQKFSLYGGKTTATYLGALLGAVTGLVMFPFLFVGILAVLAMLLNILLIRDSRERVLIPAGVERRQPSLASYKPAFTNRSLYSVYFVAFMGKWSDSWFQSVSLLYLLLLGYKKIEVGAIAASFGVLWSVLNAYSGWFSDFFGRRRIALAGTLMGVVTPLLFFWYLQGSRNVSLGIAVAALWGLGTGLYYGITEVVPGDVARLAERGAIIGTFRFFRDTGNVLVPMIFAFITDPSVFGFPKNYWGGGEVGRYGLTLWATSGMMLITAGVVWLVMRETFTPKQPDPKAVRAPAPGA
ncbi:MAG TPA: MFS transporter [Candidatus Acidoferrales bacterium]|nr:MFS transporter [Candidatus Acidoferrales bacterium]